MIVADCWANPGAPFDAQRVPFGVKLLPAAGKNEKDRIGATVSGRVLTEPGGTGVAGARVGLRNRIGQAWSRYAVTAARRHLHLRRRPVQQEAPAQRERLDRAYTSMRPGSRPPRTGRPASGARPSGWLSNSRTCVHTTCI